jgi:hypothetical protein
MEDGDRESVAAQIFPDVFDRIEFGCVGRQLDESDVFGDDEIFGDVIAGAVGDDGGVCVGTYLTADLGEMQGHGFGVGGWEDKGRGGTALRTNGTEDVGPFVALVARRARAHPALGPDAGQRALLADPRFVLEPDFDGLACGVVGELRRDGRGEVFLKASWASSSASG